MHYAHKQRVHAAGRGDDHDGAFSAAPGWSSAGVFSPFLSLSLSFLCVFSPFLSLSLSFLSRLSPSFSFFLLLSPSFSFFLLLSFFRSLCLLVSSCLFLSLLVSFCLFSAPLVSPCLPLSLHLLPSLEHSSPTNLFVSSPTNLFVTHTHKGRSRWSLLSRRRSSPEVPPRP